MNRRQFTTSLSALAAAPAVPLRAMAAAPAAATTVPNTARFWAIYMSHLHGSCSAATLSTMTGLDVSVAQKCLTSMISEGVLKPTRILTNVTSSQANTAKQPSKWQERVKKFMEDKSDTTPILEEDTNEELIDGNTQEEDEQS